MGANFNNECTVTYVRSLSVANCIVYVFTSYKNSRGILIYDLLLVGSSGYRLVVLRWRCVFLERNRATFT